jgi:hypothetical protein
MSEICVGGGQGCWYCGETYGDHHDGCIVKEEKNTPLRFRIRLNAQHPNGSKALYRYGCYFPLTDLVVGDMGWRGTGKPIDVEWIDKGKESEDAQHPNTQV